MSLGYQVTLTGESRIRMAIIEALSRKVEVRSRDNYFTHGNYYLFSLHFIYLWRHMRWMKNVPKVFAPCPLSFGFLRIEFFMCTFRYYIYYSKQ